MQRNSRTVDYAGNVISCAKLMARSYRLIYTLFTFYLPFKQLLKCEALLRILFSVPTFIQYDTKISMIQKSV